MRNFKKFLALVMATLMILSAAVITTGAADSKADYTEAAQHLVALKIMKGDEKGNLMLENGVTRYQAALFFAQTLSGETRVEVWNAEKTSTVFKDVTAYGTAMKYPYGYILAAKKLNLTDNVEKVDFKAALTRGETSQIIWDMLNTKVAVVDPLSDKILYPDDTGLTDALIGKDGKKIPRKTLLEQSGYASGKIESVIVDFKAADKNNDFDVVTLEGGLEINAADLGITAKTPKISYMGLPVSLLIDCATEDFEGKYNVDPAESKANVVYADYETYTTVENLGKAGNIRVDSKALTLNGAKFSLDKYVFDLKLFDTDKSFADAWSSATSAENNEFLKNFHYDAKKGYDVDGANTYGKVAYRVIEDGYTDTSVNKTYDVVELLYTPYVLGQYKVFNTKDATTSKNADFAAYSANYGETYKLFGSNATITDKTAAVSRKNGEAAKAVTVEGETVKSGDFVYYAYNDADNILTVALNCGNFQTGRLTSVASNGETVKISGTTYKMAVAVKPADIKKDYIGKLEVGKDNVKFLAIDGKIVKMSPISKDSTSASEGYDYAIISTDAETVASVLDLTKDQYNAALKAGVYVADKGAAVAVLDKTTGKWEVGYISGVASDYDATKEVFNVTTDVASMASFKDMGLTLDPVKEAAFAAAKAVLDTQDHIVAVVSEKDGAMVVADKMQGGSKIVASGRGENGITLTSAAKVTSYIYEISLDDDAAIIAADKKQRKTYTDTTRFIAIGGDTGVVATRVGAYSPLGDSNKFVGTAATFYAASSDLFVFVLDKSNKDNLETWSGKSATTTANYFMVMPNTTYDIEENADGKFVLVVKDLFDLKTLKTAADQTIEYTDANLKLLANAAGTVLKRDAKNVFAAVGNYTKLGTTLDIYKALVAGIKTSMDLCDGKKNHSGKDGIAICFDHLVMNGEFVGFGGTENANATYLKAKVITLDLTDIDTADFDYSAAYLAGVKYTEAIGKMYDYAAETDKGDLAFPINGDVVEDITAETEGVLNQMMVDFRNETVTIPAVDDGTAPVTVNVHYYGAKTESAGIATAIVFRVITK